MNKWLLAIVLTLSAALLPTLARAAACTEVGAIDASLNTGNYCLSANLVANRTSGEFIQIINNNVVLDCRGYALINTSTSTTGEAVGIRFSGLEHVTIRNCRIIGGFMAGIYAYQNNGSYNLNRDIEITGNTISGAKWYGILAYGTDITIRGNTVRDIGGRASFAMGIRVGGSALAGQPRFHVVADNTVANVTSPVNHAYGIYSNNSDSGRFTGNTIVRTTAVDTTSYLGQGIRVATGGDNQLADNHIVGSGKGNDIDIVGNADDACFHNFLRPTDSTLVCDATLGNY
jgi:parallel beta-helix repeat protein